MSKQSEHKPNVPKLRFPEFSGEWEEKRLGDYAYIKGRLGWKGLKQEEYVENGYAHLIASKHIKNGYIMWSSTDQINEFRYKESLEIGLEENDIIFSKDGSLGNPAIIKEMPKPATINSTMMLVRLDKELVSPYFFYQILLSNQFQRLIHLKVSGSSIPHLFQADMKQFKFFSPSLREQKKIGEFFSKIDRQIELEEKKLALLEEQKKGYMQKIFSQELRFKDENGNEYPEWKEKKLSELLRRRDQRQIPSDNAPLMAFTSTGGIEPKGKRYNREFLVKDANKKYKKTMMDDLIYSSNNLDVGAIGRNRYGTAVISDVYEVFFLKTSNSPLFFGYFITDKRFINKILKYRQGALYGQYRIHAKDFMNTKVLVPSSKEQYKIGIFLQRLDLMKDKSNEKIKLLKLCKKRFLFELII